MLGRNLDDNVSIDAVAAAARLSPSRLMGLAQGQLGAPLRHYRRWLRAFRVARDYATGASLTTAALAAGFSSSAHSPQPRARISESVRRISSPRKIVVTFG